MNFDRCYEEWREDVFLPSTQDAFWPSVGGWEGAGTCRVLWWAYLVAPCVWEGCLCTQVIVCAQGCHRSVGAVAWVATVCACLPSLSFYLFVDD